MLVIFNIEKVSHLSLSHIELKMTLTSIPQENFMLIEEASE